MDGWSRRLLNGLTNRSRLWSCWWNRIPILAGTRPAIDNWTRFQSDDSTSDWSVWPRGPFAGWRSFSTWWSNAHTQQQQQQNFWVEIDQIEIPNSQKELFVACFFFVKFFFLRTKIRPSVWLGERGVMCGTHLANERCYGRTDGPPPERKHNTRKLSWNENFDVHTEMGKQSSGNDAGRHFPFVSFESIQFFGEKLCAELIGPFLFKRRRRRRAVFTQAGTT